MSKADYSEKENLKDEILKQITSTKFALTPAQLYNIDSVKNLTQPNEVRLQIREIKRRCNQLVKDGKLLDTEAPQDKQGEASGPYSINPNASPIPKSPKATLVPTPKPKPQTIIKPKILISIDSLNLDLIKLIVKEHRKKYGGTQEPGSIEELLDVKKSLLSNSEQPDEITTLVSHELQFDYSKVYPLIVEFMAGYFTEDKIIASLEHTTNSTYTTEQARKILSGCNVDELKTYSSNLLVYNLFQPETVNLLASAMAIDKFVNKPEATELPEKKELTPEDITVQDIILIAKSGNTTLEELAKDNSTPQWLISGVTESKELQGFNITDQNIVTKGIHKLYLEIQEQQKKELDVPIDPRIILSKDLLNKISSGNLSKNQKQIILEAREIDPLLDKLTSYVIDSKDYELTPIAVRLKENDGKLPFGLWQRILIHSQNGTMLEINRENLPVYQKLKFIINRIDSVTNRDDRELLTKTLFEFPGYDIKPISPQLVNLIESYFSQLSQSPVSSFNKDDITKKLTLLDTITLSDSDKRILINMHNILDADTMQKANTLVINNILHQNAKKLDKDLLDLGKSEYSEITFIAPISAEEKLLNTIASRITISTAPKVAHMVQEVLSLSESQIEELYEDLLSGKDTEVNEGLIYLYHKNLIPSLIYDTIRNILKRK